jgi:hypothetical protein
VPEHKTAIAQHARAYVEEYTKAGQPAPSGDRTDVTGFIPVTSSLARPEMEQPIS